MTHKNRHDLAVIPIFDLGCLSGFEPELEVPQTSVLTITP